MPTECEKALSTLLTECRNLAAQAREAAQAGPRSKEVLDDLRKATAHVELALDSIDTTPQESGTSRSLRDRVTRLAGRLARNGAPEGERMADSIASLRRSRRENVREGFTGFAACVPLPELLGFLHVQAKSGTLRVNLEREVLSIAFRDGDLVYAFSDNSPAGYRLGEMLVSQGALKREELQTFLVYHSTQGGKLGQALEVRDLVTEEDLRTALDRQMHALFARLFAAEDARFSFRDDEIPVATEEGGHNVMQLLLEGARVHDEARKAKPAPEEPGPEESLSTKLSLKRDHRRSQRPE